MNLVFSVCIKVVAHVTETDLQLPRQSAGRRHVIIISRCGR